MRLLPPANKVWGKVIFLHMCVILSTGGSMCGCRGGVHGCRGCVWLPGGHAWLGGMHGCQGGVLDCGGCVWLPGACMVAGGWGCQGACVAFWGACVVVGGHVWLPGGLCMVAWGCVGYNKIWSMSGRYASYWNAFLLSNAVEDFFGRSQKTPLEMLSN